MIPKEKLDKLIVDILKEQNYEYCNFMDAKKTFCIDGTEGKIITIDRITLFIYGSNLEWNDLNYVRGSLYERYTGVCTREEGKKWHEYYSLLRFLLVKQSLLPFDIKKEERPDFVLTHEKKKIGIEVTEFTTKKDSILRRICESVCLAAKTESPKTECELRKIARQKYGGAADEYIYRTITGVLAVSRKVYRMDIGINHYAKLVVNKYRKYRSQIARYDEFIILCDARNCLEVTEKRDSQKVVELAKMTERRLEECKVCVLRVDDNSRMHMDPF